MMPRFSRKAIVVLSVAALLVGAGIVALRAITLPIGVNTLKAPEITQTAPGIDSLPFLTQTSVSPLSTPPLGGPSATPPVSALPTPDSAASLTPTARATPPPSTPVPLPTLASPTGTPLLPPGSPGMATNLRAEIECKDLAPIANLNWTPALNRGSAQRLDVATFIGGFERGEFETTGPLPPDQSALLWERVRPGVLHYWRVLTLYKDSWTPSETASFNGLTCLGDFIPTSPP